MNPRVLLASGIAVVGVFLPSAAFAQTADDPYVKPPPSEVKGELITRPADVSPAAEDAPADVAGVNQTRTAPASQSRSSLPVTGSDLVGLTVIGLAAVAGGTVLVRKSRTGTVAAG